ncbi:hypothetical protein JAAARDRAFT_127591 [Jaapia argillacea MUCL 33604]|uniref:Uncharacterized protein n=1 Tax=Jaapia argillacea MUCL 33604 TaxID=933084 RepID=A0A067PYT2_9AGAM|nr:hypothetical protein JAAARDRAFT_127591 [Jaapia argillacea MUCL 33604]
MQTTVLVSTFPGAPFSTLSLSVPSTTPFESLCDLLRERYPALPPSDDLYLSRHSGGIPPASTPLSSLCSEDEGGRLVSLRLSTRLLGGKGGFGSQLRAAGGRMSSQKTSNNDSCRDLSGRRLSTIKEAKKLAEYMESEPDRKKVAAEQAKAKLEALEKKIAEPNPGAKRRFDDTEYMEQTREIADGVKSAVAAGLFPTPPFLCRHLELTHVVT